MDVCRIIAQHRDAYRITTPTGERQGVLAGRLRHETVRQSDLPAVGDFVAIRPAEHDGPAIIDRKSVV